MNLQDILLQRTEGLWEFIATAAGNAEAVEKTLRGLSPQELERGPHGYADSPNIVSERVEALAAYNSRMLAELAQSWIDPHDIGNHSWTDWWRIVWSTSLRHLKELGMIEREQVDVPELRQEVDILWYDPQKWLVSWHNLAEEIIPRPLLNYSLIRQKAQCELAESHLSATDLQTVPIVMLRLLRGRASRLDASARDWVTTMGRTCLDQDSIGAQLTFELSIEIAPEIHEEFNLALLERLTQYEDRYYPRKVAPMVYTLLGNWRSP